MVRGTMWESKGTEMGLPCGGWMSRDSECKLRSRLARPQRPLECQGFHPEDNAEVVKGFFFQSELF